jgi:hypothetical protein
VRGLKRPIATISAAATAATAAVSRLDAQSREARRADSRRARAVAAAAATAARAEKDATAAKAAVEAAAAKKQRPAGHNPQVRMEGLPPGWAAFLDERTKYTYFYNARTRQSTWESPAGAPVEEVGLPAGWKAYRTAAGKVYYAHGRCGAAEWRRQGCVVCFDGSLK